MRNRLWYEMVQAKYNNQYTCLLIAGGGGGFSYLGNPIAFF